MTNLYDCARKAKTGVGSVRINPLLLAAMIALPILATGASAASASSHYIRAGATGLATGTDWTNAYTDLPSSLIRGDIYYLAVGFYGPHTFNDSVNGSLMITVKAATASDHGSESGWSSSYVGQAVFSSTAASTWYIWSSYYLFDGVTGSGKSGYGIRVYNSNLAASAVIYASNGATSNYVTMQHLEVQGAGPGNSCQQELITWNQTGNPTGITIQYNYIHNGGQEWINIGICSINTVIQYNVFDMCWSGNIAYHATGICIASGGFTNDQNFTICFNVMSNVYGTSYIEGQGNGQGTPEYCNGIHIYGNVIYENNVNAGVSGGLFSYVDATGCGNNVTIYNNTMYGCNNLYGVVVASSYACTNFFVYNNIFQNMANTPTFASAGDFMHDSSNIMNTGEVHFLNPTNQNFQLASPTRSGDVLNSPFNVDPNGVMRGSDGSWSIGAFEFTGLLTSVPTGLRLKK